MRLFLTSTAALLLAAASAGAATVRAKLALATADGPGRDVGSVTFKDAPGGARIVVRLHDLPPGAHGFHVHDKGSCAPGPDKTGKIIPAGAAGGHYDPEMTGKHAGPEGLGHQGDLPVLQVDDAGRAKLEVTAPHIASVATLAGHALMVHVEGDTYSDEPAPLGGGGARLACGVIG